jgi:hypothetical protein
MGCRPGREQRHGEIARDPLVIRARDSRKMIRPFQVTAVCDEITNSQLNAVTAVVQPTGNPSDFGLAAGLSSGIPIISLPVKIQLQNPLLGPNCYLGSDSDPIVLHPQNATTPDCQLGTVRRKRDTRRVERGDVRDFQHGRNPGRRHSRHPRSERLRAARRARRRG